MRPGPGARIVALVPAYERADSVAATVHALRAVPGVDEVVVIDDGSRDATADVARGAGARVVRLPSNLGKGGALAAGVDASPGAQVYLLLDADIGATAVAAHSLLGPVLADEADMTIAVLPSAGRRGGFGLVRSLSRWGIRRACGFVASAPLSGQRALRADLLRSLEPAARFGLEVGLTIDAVRQGARVLEVPVAMDHRHTGRRLSGFAHRGRQGVDIVRALWPRLTSARSRMVALLVGVMVMFAAVGWSGTRWEPSSVPARAPASAVVIVGVPRLAWADVGTGHMPNLDRLIEHGALGAMSLRSLAPVPDVASAYATLGAGTRADAGIHPSRARGGLGRALHTAGLRTAVVTAPGSRARAASALMDERGTVDVERVLGAEREVAGLLASGAGRARLLASGPARVDVVLVDAGDLDRAAAFAAVASPRAAAEARRRALTSTDELIGRLSRSLPSDALLLVAGVVPPGREWRLGPLVASGAGTVPGYLQSASTKRLGLVTLTDLAPTVLTALDVEVPDGMVGHELRYHPDTPDVSRLARLDRDSSYREDIYYRVTFGYVVLQVLLYLFAAYAFARPGGAGATRRLLRVAVVALAAWPLATFVFRALPGVNGLGPGALAVLLVVEALVTALALRSRRRPLGPLVWLTGATAWLILADVATGARLQVASIMGYSPHDGGRFFGIGNVAFAILTVTAILAACFHLEHAPRRREAYVAVVAFLGLVVVVDGAPRLGNDVGGILTLVPVFALTLYVLRGRQLTWRAVAGVVLATVAVVAMVGVIDLLRPPHARTHLGAFVSDLARGDAAQSLDTVLRKLQANLDVLRISVGTSAVPVIAAAILYLLVRKRRATALLPTQSPRRAGVIGALAAGLVGSAVNDSGVVIIALVLVYLGPVLTLLALERERSDGGIPVRA